MKNSPLKRNKPLQRSGPLRTSHSKRNRNSRRKDTEYTTGVRLYVRERDEYCRVCGRAGDQVHHVIPRGRYKVHPEWYNLTGVHDKRNLMWVCWKCQNWAHASEDNLQYVIRIQEQRFGVLRKTEVMV